LGIKLPGNIDPNRSNRRVINFGTSTTVTGIVTICHQTRPDAPWTAQLVKTRQQGLLSKTTPGAPGRTLFMHPIFN